MATLDPGNIVNGNVIEPNDLLQLYQAFGTGSGASITGLAMTGSLYGNALTATTATTATSASKITTITTGSGAVYYPVVVNSGGSTNTPIVVSTFELSGSVLNNITASRAITASYALNAGSSIPSSVTVNTTAAPTQTLKPFAGSGSFSGGILNVDMSTTFPTLSPSALGVDLFVTATAASNNEYVGVSFAGNTLTFRSSAAGSTGIFYYIGWCK